jgi:hypothetical protein
MQGGYQREMQFELARPLPPPGQIERPATAVDAAALSFPADLSVKTLR